MPTEQPEAAVTQRENSGADAWRHASLRDLIPSVAEDTAPESPSEEPVPPDVPAGVEAAASVSPAADQPIVEAAASVSPAADQPIVEVAPRGPMDARSLDELERDLARLAERLREPSPWSSPRAGSAPQSVDSAGATPAVGEAAGQPDLSATDRKNIAAAVARLDAERADAAMTAETERIREATAAEGASDVGDAADAGWSDPAEGAAVPGWSERADAFGSEGAAIASDVVDTADIAADDVEAVPDPDVAPELDPASLDLREGEPADPTHDELDLRGPNPPPPAGAGSTVGTPPSGEATLDADAMAFVRDLSDRNETTSATSGAPIAPAAADIYDLGASRTAESEPAAAADARSETPIADPSPDGVFDLRTGVEAAGSATPVAPSSQSPTVEWDAIVAEAPSVPVAEEVAPSVPAAEESGVAASAPSVDGEPEVEGPAGETPDVEAEVTTTPTADAPEVALPTAAPVEVSTVDWDAVVGDSSDAGDSGIGMPAGADPSGPEVAPPAIASNPAHPPRIQAPDEPVEPKLPARADASDDRPFTSTISVRNRSTLAQASLLTSLCADGLRDDDVAVLDGPAAAALDELVAGFDEDLAPNLRAKTLRTDVVGESVPLAMGLASLPVASAPARRIFAVVDRAELEHGSSWAALDALGESSPTPPVLIVTVDPSEMRPDERPDRLVQRWARRLLDLGWRAVDLRYGRAHRHHLEQNDAGTEMTVLLDAERLDDRISAGLIDVGGNDLDDLRWFWDVVHRSRRPTVAFVYVSPPPSIPSESASSIAALADRIQNEAPAAPRVPMLGLVRFDPEVHAAPDTQTAVLGALSTLVCDDAAFRTAIIVVSIGRCPLEMPDGAVVVEVGEEAAAVSLARAASALGRLPIVIGPDERMAGAVLAMAPTTESDAGDAVLIGLHAGIDAGSELAAVRSRSVPAIATATPRLEVVEPFATDWVDAQFRDALHRVDVGEGSTYLRVSRRELPASHVEDAQLGPALRRGGALLHRSLDDPMVVLVGVGHLVPTALDAAMKLESEGVATDVVGIAIADRLREAGSGKSETSPSGLDQLIEAQRGHRLAVVLHDALGGLEWIGGATGLRAVAITPTGTEPPSADEVVETTKTALTR